MNKIPTDAPIWTLRYRIKSHPGLRYRIGLHFLGSKVDFDIFGKDLRFKNLWAIMDAKPPEEGAFGSTMAQVCMTHVML